MGSNYLDFGVAGPYTSGNNGGIGSKLLGSLGKILSGSTGGVGSAANGGSPSGALASGLSLIPGVGSILGGALGLGSSIAGMFKTSPEGKNKQQATKHQQEVEKRMDAIEAQVNNGTLDPYAGEEAINNLVASLSSGSTNEADKHGLAMASYAASLHIANIRQRQATLMNADYTGPTQSFGVVDGGTGANMFAKNGANYVANASPNGNGNYTGLQLGETAQKERGQSLIRNMLMGTTSGNNFAAATPAGKLLAPYEDPGNAFNKYMATAKNFGSNNNVSISVGNGQGMQDLGAKLKATMGRYGL
jgi:hypothetical protein